MKIVMKKNPIVEVDENQMLRLRYGKGAVEKFSAYNRRERKECEQAQELKSVRQRSPLGNLIMEIPDVLFFQETLKEKGFWLDRDQWKTRMAQFWEEYPDLRRKKTKSNPFGKTKYAPRVI